MFVPLGAEVCKRVDDDAVDHVKDNRDDHDEESEIVHDTRCKVRVSNTALQKDVTDATSLTETLYLK